MDRLKSIRQSVIGRWDACPLSLRLEMESTRRSPGEPASVGTLGHRWVERALRWMVANQERQIPVEVGMDWLGVIVAQRDVRDRDVVHISARGLEHLRIMVTKWCYQHEYSVERIAFIEEPLETTIDVHGPNGTTYKRTITGRPDLVMTGPGEDEAGFVDQKFGWAKPSRARDVDSEEGSDKLSDRGIVQQLVYSLLLFDNFSALNRIWAREFYVMWGEVREASYERWQMERVRDTVAMIVANIDAAFDAGPESDRWLPSPGTHCSMCPNSRLCPIRDEVGIPATYEEAQFLIKEWHVAGEVRKERRPYVRGAVDRWGEIELPHSKGKRVVGYRDGTGSIAIYEPKERELSPYDEVLATAARERGALIDE